LPADAAAATQAPGIGVLNNQAETDQRNEKQRNYLGHGVKRIPVG
jgi:hypothetical protein